MVGLADMLAPDEIGPGPAIEPEAPPPLPAVGERRAVQAEMAAVLCLAVVPHLFHAVILYAGVKFTRPGFGFDMLQLTVMSLQVAAPLLYILWRSGSPLSTFGLLRPRWLDAGSGLLLFFGVWVANTLAWPVAWSLFGDSLLAGPAENLRVGRPQSAEDYLVFVIAMAANAFAEELAMRGYLVTRLRQLGASPWATIVISAGLFGAYHIYQGLWAGILVTLCGVVFAAAFLWLGRLWPVVLAHLLLDFLAFLYV